MHLVIDGIFWGDTKNKFSGVKFWWGILNSVLISGLLAIERWKKITDLYSYYLTGRKHKKAIILVIYSFSPSGEWGYLPSSKLPLTISCRNLCLPSCLKSEMCPLFIDSSSPHLSWSCQLRSLPSGTRVSAIWKFLCEDRQLNIIKKRHSPQHSVQPYNWSCSSSNNAIP